jgi:hypothetical protein
MKKLIYTLSLFLFISNGLYSQTIKDLELRSEEIPKSYHSTENENCISIQVCTLFKSTDIYSSFFGKVKNKKVQNFESEKDSGSIMYFEFEKEFTGVGFLEGLLWGKSKKPTKDHPETIYNKGNFLIIWSFNPGSEIQKISEEKVKQILN